MCCRLFSNSAICLVREFSRQFWGVPPFHETSRDGDTLLIHQFVLRSLSLRLIQTLKTGFPKRKVVSQPPCFKVSQPPFFRGSVSFRECGTWALEKLTYCTFAGRAMNAKRPLRKVMDNVTEVKCGRGGHDPTLLFSNMYVIGVYWIMIIGEWKIQRFWKVPGVILRSKGLRGGDEDLMDHLGVDPTIGWPTSVHILCNG